MNNEHPIVKLRTNSQPTSKIHQEVFSFLFLVE